MKRLILIVVNIFLIVCITSCIVPAPTEEVVIMSAEKVGDEDGFFGRKFFVKVKSIDNGVVSSFYTNDVLEVGDTVHLVCTCHGKCNRRARAEQQVLEDSGSTN